MSARIVTLQRRVPALQLAALIALVLYGASTIDGFASATSVRAMLVIAALLGIAALGQTLVVMLGGIDLSVPAFIGAGATMTAVLPESNGWPFGLVLLVLVAGSFLAGGITGWLCHRFAVESLILTLGSAALVAGGISVWRNSARTGSAPEWLTDVTSVTGKTLGLGVPPVVAIWLALAVAVAVALHRTRAGRALYTTGTNPRAADLALVRTARVWFATFGVSAVCSSLTGMLLAGFAGAGDQTIGNSYLFLGLAAIVLGGMSIAGNRSDADDYWRTVVGALILTVLTTILVARGVGAADQQIAYGVVILAVVAIFGRERRIRDRI